MQRFVSLKTKISLASGLCLLLTVVVMTAYNVTSQYRSARDLAISQVRNVANAVATDVQKYFDEALVASQNLSNVVILGIKEGLPRSSVEAMAGEMLMQNRLFLASIVAFEPNAYDGKDTSYVNSAHSDSSGRFITYLAKTAGDSLKMGALTRYDVESWYQKPKELMAQCVSEPYVDVAGGRKVFMVSCTVPIVFEGHFVGVAGFDVAIDSVQDVVKESNFLGGQADIALISFGGTYVGRMLQPEYIGKNISSLVGENYQEDLRKLQAGVSYNEEQDGKFLLCIPLYFAHSVLPWQIQVLLPTEYAYAGVWQKAFVSVGIGLGLLVVILVVLSLRIRVYTNALTRLSRSAERIAAGDLAVEVAAGQGNDEVGVISQKLAQVVAGLREIVVNIQNGTTSILTASGHISTGAQQLAHSSSDAAAAVEEATASVEQMTEALARSRDSALTTEQMSNAVAAGMRNSVSMGEQVAEAIKKISAQVDSIKGIASQTNILALNAAVEAARAGEHGRGFAVVAAEVRKLSEYSQRAAVEITVLAQQCVENESKANASLAEFLPQTEKSAQLVREIAANSQEQAGGAGQINQAMQRLSWHSQQNSALSEELATSAEEMSSQAEALRDAVRAFKM